MEAVVANLPVDQAEVEACRARLGCARTNARNVRQAVGIRKEMLNDMHPKT